MNIRDFEIAEARRRMGLSGMTSSTTDVPSLSSSTSVGAGETQNARQNMGTSNSYTPQSMGMTSSTTSQGYSGMPINYTNLSSLNNVPDLNNSMSVGYSEIQKAKQDMTSGSSTNFTS